MRFITPFILFSCVTALLIMAALSQVEQNEERLVESLTQDVYCQIVSLARIYDLQLIVAALDALYYLSEIGEAACESISLVKHCIGEWEGPRAMSGCGLGLWVGMTLGYKYW